MEIKKFKLGQRVSFNKTLRKKVGYEISPLGRDKRKTIWDEISHDPCTGFICGTRTLKEGYINHNPEHGNMFEATKYIRVHLIAISLNMKQSFVPVDVIEEVENGN